MGSTEVVGVVLITTQATDLDMEAVLDAVQDQGPLEPDLVRHTGLEISWHPSAI
ncbi:MAG: hypothetical protein GY874_12465 [Desulfobacteraceae bacterium]|nr:hypothetical protein [Desulfobacteraceae bacterium]